MVVKEFKVCAKFSNLLFDALGLTYAIVVVNFLLSCVELMITLVCTVNHLLV